jgi:hypothetical protein
MNPTTTRSPGRLFGALAALVVASTALLVAQVHVAGQASAAWLKSENGASQYTFNAGRGSFLWRGDLFLDAQLSENVQFLSSFRMEQNRQLDVDLFVIRVTDVFSLPLNIEAGETELPFGNLGERRYPKSNPFLALPLGREHLTTLRSSDYVLHREDARYTSAGNGVRLIDGSLYDIGVKLSGSVGILDYAFAVTNGMVSATSGYATGGVNGSKGVGKIARLSVTPVIGLTVGISGAQGPFLREDGSYGAYAASSSGDDPFAYPQSIVGADVDFSFEHFSFYGEAFFNRWDFKEEYGAPLDAVGYSAEGRYTFAPRLSAALRVGGLLFNSIPYGAYGAPAAAAPWDHDELRVETALDYRLSRETLVKAVYTWNRTFDLPADPRDNSFGVQTVVSF